MLRSSPAARHRSPVRHPASILGPRAARMRRRARRAAGARHGLRPSPAIRPRPPAGAHDGGQRPARGPCPGGSWMAIDVHLANDGPADRGRAPARRGRPGADPLRHAVDLPTQSDKTYRLYAQPPAFGSELEVDLVDGDRRPSPRQGRVHAPRPDPAGRRHRRRAAGRHRRRPRPPAEPEQRRSGHGRLDPSRPARAGRGVGRARPACLAGHRLVEPHASSWRRCAAGSPGRRPARHRRRDAGPASLSAFPDDLLPYRPTATVDVAPEARRPARRAARTRDRPAGPVRRADRGRVAPSRRRRSTVAAERPYGSGSVTIVGFDPTVDWIAESDTAEGLWRRLLPPRTAAGRPRRRQPDRLRASQLPSLPCRRSAG